VTYLQTQHGVRVSVADDKVDRLLASGSYVRESDAGSDEAPSLTKLDKAGLQAEAEKRGLPTTGTKPELLAAIQESDAKAAAGDNPGGESEASGAVGSTPNE
jgi:hypothetical protein